MPPPPSAPDPAAPLTWDAYNAAPPPGGIEAIDPEPPCIPAPEPVPEPFQVLHRAMCGSSKSKEVHVETQATIGQWARDTFPGGDDFSPRYAIRLLEEVVELCLAAGANRNEIDDSVSQELWKHHLKTGGPDAYKIGYYSDESFPESPEKVAKEMADCAIVLDVMADRRCVDLRGEVDSKMAINRYEREWVANGDGTGYHKKKDVKS